MIEMLAYIILLILFLVALGGIIYLIERKLK